MNGSARDETQPQPSEPQPETAPAPVHVGHVGHVAHAGQVGRRASGTRNVAPLFPLGAVRRFAGLSEAAVADRMEEPDTSLVVHMESGADCAISELEAYAAALGGEIEIRITLPGWTYRVR